MDGNVGLNRMLLGNETKATRREGGVLVESTFKALTPHTSLPSIVILSVTEAHSPSAFQLWPIILF